MANTRYLDYESHDCSATAVELAEEIKRVRGERQHAISMTPLATVPLKGRARHARRPGTIRVSRQVMGYAKRRGSNY